MIQDNFPEVFKKDLKIHIERAHLILETLNPELSTSRYDVIKLQDFKDKEKYLYNTCKGKKIIKLSHGF